MNTKNKSAFTLIEVVIVMAIIALLLAISAPGLIRLIGVDWVYSDGQRTGVVSKLSKKGIIWKTCEGEMKL